MARQPKPLPREATFIRLMIHALTVEPTKKAKSEATVVRGTMAKSELKASATGTLLSCSGDGSQQTSCAIIATKALSTKASQMTKRALR